MYCNGIWTDKRAFDLFHMLTKIDLVHFRNRHKLLEYWSIHGSKISITDKD